MARYRSLHRPAALGSALLILALPSWAQDGGLRYGFGIDQRVEYTANPGFGTPAAPGTLGATTALRFGLSSQTRSEQLSFNVDYGLTIAAGGGISINPGQPHLDFSYGREAAGSALDIGLTYAVDRIETLRGVEDFIGEDGTITLPQSAEDLVGTGTRRAYGAHARLDLGGDSPLGFGLGASMERTDYAGASDPDLLDSASTGLDASLRLDLSEVTSTSLGLSYGTSQEGGISASTRSLSLGLTQNISPVLRLSADLDYSLDDFTLSPRAGLDYALASGALQLSLGPDDIALSWQQTTARAAVSARASHEGGAGGDSSLALGYSQSLNDTSGIDLGLSYTDIRDPLDNDARRTDLSASYNMAVGADWALKTGLYYGLRTEETAGSAASSAIFVTLSRNFDFQR